MALVTVAEMEERIRTSRKNNITALTPVAKIVLQHLSEIETDTVPKLRELFDSDAIDEVLGSGLVNVYDNEGIVRLWDTEADSRRIAENRRVFAIAFEKWRNL